MRSVVIIPARYNSSRFPGKPLVKLLGKPMILWVAELSAQAVNRENVYVATDNQEIAETVEKAGFQFVMTGDAVTGTDRLAQAAEAIDAQIYINVQGDEPLVDPADILKIRDTKRSHMDAIVNGFTEVSPGEDPQSVNLPKVITNENNELVYMSRLAIPGYKDIANAPVIYKKQVCIYAFTDQELRTFSNFGRKGALEKSEDIEILRFLELGKKIKMVELAPGSLSIDVPEDVSAVEAALRNRASG